MVVYRYIYIHTHLYKYMCIHISRIQSICPIALKPIYALVLQNGRGSVVFRCYGMTQQRLTFSMDNV